MSGFPEEGLTQRIRYHLENMEGELPIRLGQNGRGHTFVHLYVGDDVNAEANHVDSVALRLLLSDPHSKDLSADECIEPGVARKSTYGEPDKLTTPVSKEMLKRIEVRLNNISLGQPLVKTGWLIFSVKPGHLSQGINLVGIRVAAEDIKNVCVDLTRCLRSKEPPKLPEKAVHDITVERLELDVRYRSGTDKTPRL